MLRDRSSTDLSEFLRYLAAHPEAEDGLPSLPELSRELGISVAGLREQLEVARALGLVEVRPRTGTRRRPFSFAPAVNQTLGYALALDGSHFGKFAELRNHIEAAYWEEAVSQLTDEDKRQLQQLVVRAREKLRGNPVCRGDRPRGAGLPAGSQKFAWPRTPSSAPWRCPSAAPRRARRSSGPCRPWSSRRAPRCPSIASPPAARWLRAPGSVDARRAAEPPAAAEGAAGPSAAVVAAVETEAAESPGAAAAGCTAA